jgi:hypothetical protein
MKFNYTWRELPRDSDPFSIRWEATADLELTTAEGDTVLFEQYVPIYDLALSLYAWVGQARSGSDFKYAPDGYNFETMVAFVQSVEANTYIIETPDTPASHEISISFKEIEKLALNLRFSVETDIGAIFGGHFIVHDVGELGQE